MRSFAFARGERMADHHGMSSWWWVILGFVAGLAVMAPVMRLLLRRAERRARRAERRARNVERLAELGSLTGGLAHEIKNPLSTIGLNAQLLAEGIAESTLPDDLRERLLRRLTALRREAERLRDILTDFLQFAGRVKLDPQPRNLGRIVEEISDFFHPQCDKVRVLLRVDLPREPVTLPVDEGLFKQALLNLMLNAVQSMGGADEPASDDHRQRGELIVRVERDDLSREARVHVIDTGSGVSSDKLEEIFRPYVSGRKGGTGLGLPTARRIIEEHGGRLEVHSVPGRGSDFMIHLPLDQTRADE